MTAPARPSALALPCGRTLPLPAFLPDATRGVVRGCDGDELRAVGIPGVVANAFHLARAPGTRLLKSLGGLAAFAGCDLPVCTDSGGFQVFSLADQPEWRVQVGARGVRFRRKGEKRGTLLTPEKSLEHQFRIGADVVVCLDECAAADASRSAHEASVERTIAWAERSRDAHARLAKQTGRRPLLFAVVQGGPHADLRQRCVTALAALGCDGLAFGGWPVTPDDRLQDAVAWVAAAAPPGLPLWALGVGKPEHVVSAAALGYGLFDCTLPTRDGRRGRCFRLAGAWPPGAFAWDYVRLDDTKLHADARPIDETCDCPACRRHSRAFLHHLHVAGDALADRLATLHNLRFYARLMGALRGPGGVS